MKASIVEATIKAGDGVMTIRRKGISSTVIAQILGRQVLDGVEVITLDRLIHRQGETEMGNDAETWSVSGAFVTVLSRTHEQPVQASSAP